MTIERVAQRESDSRYLRPAISGLRGNYDCVFAVAYLTLTGVWMSAHPPPYEGFRHSLPHLILLIGVNVLIVLGRRYRRLYKEPA